MSVPRGLKWPIPLLILALALTGAACTGGGPGSTATSAVPTPTQQAPVPTSTVTLSTLGTLEIRVTDKPDPAISAIEITAENVEVHRADTGEWSTVVVGPVSFDLIQVSGIEELLGSEALPPGEYTQVRLGITSATIVDDGVEVEARVPSDVLKVVRPFTITAGQTTIATLDFDAERSVVRQGTGEYLLRPMITLLVRQGGEPFEPASTPDAATGDFFLTIEEPSEPESIIAEASITVVGRTRLDATVSVNDVFANVDEDGRFRVRVDLELGPNIVEVVASLDSGEMLDQILVIIYSP